MEPDPFRDPSLSSFFRWVDSLTHRVASCADLPRRYPLSMVPGKSTYPRTGTSFTIAFYAWSNPADGLFA